jgi:outer membrane protein assembly factor BamB
VIALLLLTFAAADWGQFRGPNGSGVGEGTGYPVEFSPTKNVVWKAPIPFGQSSPVVAGGKVYVTASEPGGALITIALDARTGKQAWRREIKKDKFTQIYKANDPASPSPVADADGVIVFFPDVGLAAYTHDGKDRWTLPLGPFQNFYGMSGSPIVSGDLVILVCDQLSKSFAIAVDRKTGKQRWKTERKEATLGWASPMVFQSQLIVIGSTRVDSYHLSTGEQRWWMPVASSGSQGVAVSNGDNLYFLTSGTGEPWMPTFESTLTNLDKDGDKRLSPSEFMGMKDLADQFGAFDLNSDAFIDSAEWSFVRNMSIGEGGVFALRSAGSLKGKLEPKSASAWQFKKNLPFIPAPLLYGDVLYMVRDGGIVTALDAASGKLLKQGRAALGEYYASPVAADGKLYLANGEGKLTVLKAGAQWEVLATNDLAEEVRGTPALNNGRLFVRTRGAIYCFGQ